MKYTIPMLLVLALALASCQQELPGHESVNAEAATEGQDSLYLLGSEWTDQTGAPRQLMDFSGRLIVTAMIFTNCSYACPRIVVDLKAIEAGIPDGREQDVHILLVSMDSARDTPEVLTAFAASQGLDPDQWTLITGDDFAVRGVGAALGVRFKKGIKGDFAHSNIITVLNRKGQILHQLEGLNADAAVTQEIIRANLLPL